MCELPLALILIIVRVLVSSSSVFTSNFQMIHLAYGISFRQ